MLRALALLSLSPLLIGAAGSTVPSQTVSSRTVADTRAEAEAAVARGDALRVRAERAERDVRRTAARRRALEREIAAQEDQLEQARAALADIGQRRTREERQLAVARAPLMRLTGALERVSRQPAGYALLRPGSLNDLVHVRAILDSSIPRIEARTQATRQSLRCIDALRAAQDDVLQRISLARARLSERRQSLAQAEIAERRAAEQLLGGAVRERSRALALGEEARDIISTEQRDRAKADVLAALSTLPPPPMPAGDVVPERHVSVYRLPVTGTVARGFGEISRSGYRERGLTIKAAPGAAVKAPAAGIVRFAGRYRSFGAIVIVDHGAGWTSLLTGMSDLSVKESARVTAGLPLGRAAGAVTLELRRSGRPVDVAAML